MKEEDYLEMSEAFRKADKAVGVLKQKVLHIALLEQAIRSKRSLEVRDGDIYIDDTPLKDLLQILKKGL